MKKKNKNTTKKSSRRVIEDAPRYKPTLLIDSKKTKANFNVGSKATVLVSGKIIEESLDNWDAPKRKSYKMEIDKIIAYKLGKRTKQ